MRELKRLERRIHWCECIHLGLTTLSVAVTLALLFKEDDPLYRLVWAIGTVIPVQIIRLISERVSKLWLRALLCVGVLAAAIFVARNDFHWIYYVIACIPILISGLFLPRPNGKLIFTRPNVIALLGSVLPYAIGQVTQVPLLSRIAIALSALITLNFFLHFNQSRLLTDIRMSVHAEVSVHGMIRQNQKVVAIFILAGILVLAAIPFLLRTEPPQTEETYLVESPEETPAPTPTPFIPKQYTLTRDDRSINLDFLTYFALPFVFAPLLVVAGLIYCIYMLFSSIDRRKKHDLPEIDDTVTIERLEPETDKRARERLTGYEKKIRRHYERLIKSRAPKESQLTTLTPTELEQTARIHGNGAETIHEVYRNTRYSGKPATKESYAAFRDAVKSLPAVQAQRKDADV